MNRFALLSFSVLFFVLAAHSASAVEIDPKAGLPKLYPMTPITALKDATVWYSAKVSDNELLESCELYVDDKLNQKMKIKKDVITASLKLTETGSYDFRIKCTDSDKYVVESKTMMITVLSGTSSVKPGDIIKMGCPAVVYPNHPCTAVYYYGVDGKRHAFSNERVYKSWFKNFDDLIIVSENVMSDIPLGKNVTYRPGERLVKFTTPTVYAVSFSGLLRPIANAEIAESLYGSNWVSLIESVDDVFFGNYRIGYTIESTNDFSWSAAQSETNSIDKTF